MFDSILTSQRRPFEQVHTQEKVVKKNAGRWQYQPPINNFNNLAPGFLDKNSPSVSATSLKERHSFPLPEELTNLPSVNGNLGSRDNTGHNKNKKTGQTDNNRAPDGSECAAGLSRCSKVNCLAAGLAGMVGSTAVRLTQTTANLSPSTIAVTAVQHAPSLIAAVADNNSNVATGAKYVGVAITAAGVAMSVATACTAPPMAGAAILGITTTRLAGQYLTHNGVRWGCEWLPDSIRGAVTPWVHACAEVGLAAIAPSWFKDADGNYHFSWLEKKASDNGIQLLKRDNLDCVVHHGKELCLIPGAKLSVNVIMPEASTIDQITASDSGDSFSEVASGIHLPSIIESESTQLTPGQLPTSTGPENVGEDVFYDASDKVHQLAPDRLPTDSTLDNDGEDVFYDASDKVYHNDDKAVKYLSQRDANPDIRSSWTAPGVAEQVGDIITSSLEGIDNALATILTTVLPIKPVGASPVTCFNDYSSCLSHVTNSTFQESVRMPGWIVGDVVTRGEESRSLTVYMKSDGTSAGRQTLKAFFYQGDIGLHQIEVAQRIMLSKLKGTKLENVQRYSESMTLHSSYSPTASINVFVVLNENLGIADQHLGYARPGVRIKMNFFPECQFRSFDQLYVPQDPPRGVLNSFPKIALAPFGDIPGMPGWLVGQVSLIADARKGMFDVYIKNDNSSHGVQLQNRLCDDDELIHTAASYLYAVLGVSSKSVDDIKREGAFQKFPDWWPTEEFSPRHMQRIIKTNEYSDHPLDFPTGSSIYDPRLTMYLVLNESSSDFGEDEINYKGKNIGYGSPAARVTFSTYVPNGRPDSSGTLTLDYSTIDSLFIPEGANLDFNIEDDTCPAGWFSSVLTIPYAGLGIAFKGHLSSSNQLDKLRLTNSDLIKPVCLELKRCISERLTSTKNLVLQRNLGELSVSSQVTAHSISFEQGGENNQLILYPGKNPVFGHSMPAVIVTTDSSLYDNSIDVTFYHSLTINPPNGISTPAVDTPDYFCPSKDGSQYSIANINYGNDIGFMKSPVQIMSPNAPVAMLSSPEGQFILSSLLLRRSRTVLSTIPDDTQLMEAYQQKFGNQTNLLINGTETNQEEVFKRSIQSGSDQLMLWLFSATDVPDEKNPAIIVSTEYDQSTDSTTLNYRLYVPDQSKELPSSVCSQNDFVSKPKNAPGNWKIWKPSIPIHGSNVPFRALLFSTNDSIKNIMLGCPILMAAAELLHCSASPAKKKCESINTIIPEKVSSRFNLNSDAVTVSHPVEQISYPNSPPRISRLILSRNGLARANDHSVVVVDIINDDISSVAFSISQGLCPAYLPKKGIKFDEFWREYAKRMETIRYVEQGVDGFGNPLPTGLPGLPTSIDDIDPTSAADPMGQISGAGGRTDTHLNPRRIYQASESGLYDGWIGRESVFDTHLSGKVKVYIEQRTVTSFIDFFKSCEQPLLEILLTALANAEQPSLTLQECLNTYKAQLGAPVSNYQIVNDFTDEDVDLPNLTTKNTMEVYKYPVDNTIEGKAVDRMQNPFIRLDLNLDDACRKSLDIAVYLPRVQDDNAEMIHLVDCDDYVPSQYAWCEGQMTIDSHPLLGSLTVDVLIQSTSEIEVKAFITEAITDMAVSLLFLKEDARITDSERIIQLYNQNTLNQGDFISANMPALFTDEDSWHKHLITIRDEGAGAAERSIFYKFSRNTCPDEVNPQVITKVIEDSTGTRSLLVDVYSPSAEDIPESAEHVAGLEKPQDFTNITDLPWGDRCYQSNVAITLRDRTNEQFKARMCSDNDRAQSILVNPFVLRAAGELLFGCDNKRSAKCQNAIHWSEVLSSVTPLTSSSAGVTNSIKTLPAIASNTLMLSQAADMKWRNDDALVSVDFQNDEVSLNVYKKGFHGYCDPLPVNAGNLPEIKIYCVDHCNGTNSCELQPCDKFWYASKIPYFDGENFHTLTSPYHDENLELTVKDLSNKRLGECQVDPVTLEVSTDAKAIRLLKALETSIENLTDESLYSAFTPPDVLAEKGWELAFINLGFDLVSTCGGYQLFRHSVRGNIPFFAISNPLKGEIKLFFYDQAVETNNVKVCLSEAPNTRGMDQAPINYYSKAFYNGITWTDTDVVERPRMCTIVKKRVYPHWAEVIFNPLYDPGMRSTEYVDLIVEFIPTSTVDLLLTASSMGKTAGLHQFNENALWFPTGDETQEELENKFSMFATDLKSMGRVYEGTMQNGKINMKGGIYTEKGIPGKFDNVKSALSPFSSFLKGFAEIPGLFEIPAAKQLAAILKSSAGLLGGVEKSLPNGKSGEEKFEAEGRLTIEHAIPTWFTSMISGIGSGESTYQSTQIRVSYPGSQSLEKGVPRGPLDSLPSYTQTQIGLVGFTSAPKAHLTVKSVRTERRGDVVEGSMSCGTQKITKFWETRWRNPGAFWYQYTDHEESKTPDICLPTIYRSTRVTKANLRLDYKIHGYSEDTITLNPEVAAEVNDAEHFIKFTVSWRKYKHHTLRFTGYDDKRYTRCSHGKPRDSWLVGTVHKLHLFDCGNTQTLSHIGSYEPEWDYTDTYEEPSGWQRFSRFSEMNGLREFYAHEIDRSLKYTSSKRPGVTRNTLPGFLSTAYPLVASMPRTRAELGEFHAHIRDSRGRHHSVSSYDNPLSLGTVDLDWVPLDKASHIRFRLIADNEYCTEKCELSDFIEGVTIHHQLITIFTRNNTLYMSKTSPAPLAIEDVTP